MQKSIFDFFSKKSEKNVGEEKQETQFSSILDPVNKKALSCINANDDSPIKSRTPKRKRIILDSSDEETQSNENNSHGNDNESVLIETPKKPKAKRQTIDLSQFNNSSKLTQEKNVKRESKSPEPCKIIEDENNLKLVQWSHLKENFLKSDQIKDKCGRPPSHEDYDPHTLFVPQKFLNDQSPGMKQWWILKSDNFDILLFFKVGKFYELYHMDAVIAVEELGIAFMRGSFAHSGFPEVAFQRFADILVSKGYKVARVEQTETPDAMAERNGKNKVLRREICQILTPGTSLESLRTCSSVAQDLTDFSSADQNACFVNQNDPILLALKYSTSHGDGKLFNCEFGIAILNAKTGTIYIGQFHDDRTFSRLRTLLAYHPPSQILLEHRNLNQNLMETIKSITSGVPLEILKPGKDFIPAKDLILELELNGYFKNLISEDKSIYAEVWPDKSNWPIPIMNDLCGRKIKEEYQLAANSLGAVVSYLRYCLIDQEILSLGQIFEYSPIDSTRNASDSNFYNSQRNLLMDAITLRNLDIMRNANTGTLEGSLVEQLDNCLTNFGRRMLRKWVSAPLCNPDEIIERQKAIEDIIFLNTSNFSAEIMKTLKTSLKKLPDLERLLLKVHLMGVNGSSEKHPESRAILFEELTYSKRKIIDFVATINGFSAASIIINQIQSLPIKSILLLSLCSKKIESDELSENSFPHLDEEIRYYTSAFDHEQAKKDGCIIPEKGVDNEYDSAVKSLNEIQSEIDDYLMECSETVSLKVGSFSASFLLCYWGTGRNRLQIEVPESKIKSIPFDWKMSSQRKGFKRYRAPRCNELLNALMLAEERKEIALRHIMRNIFAKFSTHYHKFHRAIECLAKLDCLISLAEYSQNIEVLGACMPKFFHLRDSQNDQPMLRIIDGRHPCLTKTFTGGDIIPNSIFMGCSEDADCRETKPNCIVVTGPNMGGKSTLMRQVALITIIAHVGCYVPAAECELTPVDRIFTRLGASDKLLAGESTFMLELSECACILNHATRDSLILLDELGRGTSTHDGCALASAVLQYLATPRISNFTPRCLFSTHYHSLLDQIRSSTEDNKKPLIAMGHMACVVEDPLEEMENSDPRQLKLESITFLYKFVSGICPRSYGFNAARLAHIPDRITRYAMKKAKEFEKVTTTFTAFRDLMFARIIHPGQIEELRDRLIAL